MDSKKIKKIRDELLDTIKRIASAKRIANDAQEILNNELDVLHRQVEEYAEEEIHDHS